MKNIIKLLSISTGLVVTSNAFANLYPGKFENYGAFTPWSEGAPFDVDAGLPFYNDLCKPIVNKLVKDLGKTDFSYSYYNGNLISGQIEGTLDYLDNQIKFANKGEWLNIFVNGIFGKVRYKISSASVLDIPKSLKQKNIKAIKFSYATDLSASTWLYILTSLVVSGSEDTKIPFDCYLYNSYQISL